MENKTKSITNNTNSKYLSTSNLFDEALLALLDKKEYEFISVKDICKKAGFNRSTFYLHYENIDDLLKETIEYTSNKLWKYYENISFDINTMNLNDLILINDKFLYPYLSFVKDNKIIMSLSYSKPELMGSYKKYNFIYKHIAEPILIKFNIDESKRKYIFSFYFNGIQAIVKEWVKNNYKESIEYISSLIVDFIPKLN